MEAEKKDAVVAPVPKEETPQGDVFTTAVSYDPKVKAKAYEIFLTTSMDLTDIAIDLSLPAKVVARWSREGGWLKRKQEIEAELFKSAEDKYRRFVIEKRQPTVERHLRIAEKLETAIEATIEERVNAGVVSERSLTALAKALSEVTGVSARAAAITDTPFSDASGSKQKLAPVIILGGQVNAPLQAQIIDVEAEEKPDESNPGVQSS